MAIYYPDGNGGRRILDGGSTNTTIISSETIQGALVFNGVISTETLLPNVTTKKGALGDLWSLGFTNEEKNIYKGDLLIYDGEDWGLCNVSPQRPLYTLPTANETLKGGIAVGDGLTLSGDTLNAIPYTLPTASETLKGGIFIGEGLTIEGGTLSTALDIPAPYTLPTASANQKGCVKIGTGLEMVGDVLNATIEAPEEYILPTASTTQKGGVRIGKGLYMEGDVLNVSGASDTEQDTKSINIKNIIKGSGGSGSEIITDSSYVLPTMSESTKGGAKVGQGLYMDGDTLNCTLLSSGNYTLPTASETLKGGVKIGEGLTMVGDTLNCTVTGTPARNYPMTYRGDFPEDMPDDGDIEDYGARPGDVFFNQQNNTYIIMEGGDSLHPDRITGGRLLCYQDVLREIDTSGDLSCWVDWDDGIAYLSYDLPTASTTQKGGIRIGKGLYMEGDTLNANIFLGKGNTFPPTATIGRIFYRTDESKFYLFDGTLWLTFN